MKRVGLWLIGAYGGVGSTTALGVAALAKNLSGSTGLVTALPEFAGIAWDEPATFVLGGHELRRSSFPDAVAGLHRRSHVFTAPLLEACDDELRAWSANVRPGISLRASPAIIGPGKIAGEIWSRDVRSEADALQAISEDLESFRQRFDLADVIVVNAASTEPLPASTGSDLASLPASSLYAWAAVHAGCPFVNLTPSQGGSFPSFEDHCRKHGVPHAGQDLKTGETLIKSVLAPMFAMRNLKVLSWVGHNILGNRDGQVLADPAHKASKLRTKDALMAELLGYQPQTHTSIEYIESLDDWKTAWDHIHFEGFLGTKMTMQFTWQGCDSLLAAPLVIDLARLLLLAHRRGHAGVFQPAACFFKCPLGMEYQDFSRQYQALRQYILSES